MDEGAQIMHELAINEYRPVHEAGSVLFKVAVKETVTHHFTVRYDGEGNPIKTAKQVRADFEEYGTEGWHKKDGWSDWEGDRISKVEKVVYSPCSLALQYLTPPADYPEARARYLARSTMFDEQPKELSSKNAIYRRYSRCTRYVQGKTSQVCSDCMRRIRTGWSIITPLKKEDSE